MPRLLIQPRTVTSNAVEFGHVSFQLADLRRSAGASIFFVKLRNHSVERTTVLHWRRATFPGVSDIEVTGAVEPEILLGFG